MFSFQDIQKKSFPIRLLEIVECKRRRQIHLGHRILQRLLKGWDYCWIIETAQGRNYRYLIGTSLSVSNMEYSLVKTSERSPIRLAAITASAAYRDYHWPRPSTEVLCLLNIRISGSIRAWGYRRQRKAIAIVATTKFIRSFGDPIICSLSRRKAINLLACRKLAEVVGLLLKYLDFCINNGSRLIAPPVSRFS